MTETGMSLFLADTNGLEAVHAALNKSDQRHGCRVTHAQVREALKKNHFFCDKCHTLGMGGLERVHVTKKTIASKSF